jgi:hypothetical protein
MNDGEQEMQQQVKEMKEENEISVGRDEGSKGRSGKRRSIGKGTQERVRRRMRKKEKK